MFLVANFDSSSEWILYTFFCTFSKALNCSPGGLLHLQILHAFTQPLFTHVNQWVSLGDWA